MKRLNMLLGVLIVVFNQTAANATVIFDLTTAPSGPSASYTSDGITAVFSNPTLGGSTSSFTIDSDGIPVIDGPTGFGAGLDALEVVFDQTVRLISYFPGFVEYGSETLVLSAGGSSSVETNFQDEVLTAFSNQFIVNAGQTLVVAVSNPLPLVTNELVQFRELTVERVSVPAPATLALMVLGIVGIGYQRRRQAA